MIYEEKEKKGGIIQTLVTGGWKKKSPNFKNQPKFIVLHEFC